MQSTSLGKKQSDLRIKQGKPSITKPKKEDVPLLEKEAEDTIQFNREQQRFLLSNYSFDSILDCNFLIAGGTGLGLGSSLTTVLLEVLSPKGSLTILSRDLSRSIGFETGKLFQKRAENKGIRFCWNNSGVALEGDGLAKIISDLKETASSNSLVYINTVASASSGLLPGYPPVYVKDHDVEGLFQWELTPLSEREIETTKEIMGNQALEFANVLEKNGFSIELRVFADWRGSLDHSSRDPKSMFYGRQGAYSTSLYLPKDILQKAVKEFYGKKKKMIDIFFPVMRTRALSFIPGGMMMSDVLQSLMERSGAQYFHVSELAIQALEVIQNTLFEEQLNPFPRLDSNELEFELWFYEVVARLNEDEKSPFYYKKWIRS